MIRCRNRFTELDELVQMDLVRPNEWGFREQGEKRAEESLREKLAGKLRLETVKDLERRYEESNWTFLEVIRAGEVGEVDLCESVTCLSACGEFGKVRYMRSELQRRGQLQYVQDRFSAALISGTAAGHPVRKLLEIFEEDIALTSIPSQKVYLVMLDELIKQKASKKQVESMCRAMNTMYPDLSPQGNEMLLSAYKYMQEYEKVWQIYEKLVEDRNVYITVDAISTVLEAMSLSNNLNRVEILFKHQTSHLRLRNEATFEYIKLLLRHHRSNHAARLYSNLQRRGINNVECLIFLVEELTVCGRDDLVSDLLLHVESIDDRITAYRAVGRGLVRRNTLREAVKLLLRIRSEYTVALLQGISEELRYRGALDKADIFLERLTCFPSSTDTATNHHSTPLESNA